MGRFEFVEREGSPVYRQAHSKEVPTDKNYSLYSAQVGTSPIFPPQQSNEWGRVYVADLRSSVGDKALIPPTTDWKWNNFDTKAVEEDRQLRCSSTPTSSSCSVTVSLSGLAKEIQGECEGEYNDTGLRSAGRKVIDFLM